MNLVVTGGNDYRMTRADFQFLESVVRLTGARAILTDGTCGVAAQADAWARRRGLSVQRYVADWLSERNAPPTRRNDMLAQAGDAVVAFPGGNVTADMVAKAWLKELPVHESPSWQGIITSPRAKLKLSP